MPRGKLGRPPTAPVGSDGLTNDQRRYRKHRERRLAESIERWRKSAATPEGRAVRNRYQRALYRRRRMADPTFAETVRAEGRAHYASHKGYYALRNARSAKTKEQQARRLVYHAVMVGLLKKPANCDGCAKPAVVHGHHHRGYAGDAALDILWLCRPCHGLVHRQYPD